MKKLLLSCFIITISIISISYFEFISKDVDEISFTEEKRIVQEIKKLEQKESINQTNPRQMAKRIPLKSKIFEDYQLAKQIKNTENDIENIIVKLNKVLEEKDIKLKKQKISQKVKSVYLERIDRLEKEISEINIDK